MERARGIATLGVALALAAAAVASAQEIHKWRTRDGRIFFGDKPPEGSVDLGPTGGANSSKRGKVLTDEDIAADQARAVAPEPPPEPPAEPPAEPAVDPGQGTVVGDREVAALESAEPTPEPTMDPAEARRLAPATAVRIVATTATPGKRKWTIAGSVENSGPEIVHGVEIAGAGAWKPTDPADIPPGEFATFALEVPADAPVGPRSEPPEVEVRWAEQAR